MTGGNILSIGEKDYGIVPRAVKTIFDTVEVSYSILSRAKKQTNV
jgi:hypothetical protein